MKEAMAKAKAQDIQAQESGPPAGAPGPNPWASYRNLAKSASPAGPPPAPAGPRPGDTHPGIQAIRGQIPARGQPAGVFKFRPHDDWDTQDPGCAPGNHLAMHKVRQQMKGAPMWHWTSNPPGIKIRVGDLAPDATERDISERIQDDLVEWIFWAKGHGLTPQILWADVVSVVVRGGPGHTATGATYATITVCSVRSSQPVLTEKKVN